MGRSKSHKKSKSQRERERDRFVGSWHEGSGSPAKSKAHGSKALGWRSVRGFVDRRSRRRDLGSGFVAWSGLWVRRQSQRRDLGFRFVAWSGLWVCRRSRRRDLGSLSLSLSLSLRVSLEMVWSENFDWNQFLGQTSCREGKFPTYHKLTRHIIKSTKYSRL